MRTRYRNVAFLVELMLNILVFSVSCAVLVGLFGKAGELSAKTREETMAAAQLQNMVEEFKAGSFALYGAAASAQEPGEADGGIPGLAVQTLRYDSAWNELPAGPDNNDACAYSLLLFIESGQAAEAGRLNRLWACALRGNAPEQTPRSREELLESRGGDVILSLSTARYHPNANTH